jgi:hypothetical protein
MVFCGHCSTAIRREQAQVGSLQEGLCEACWLEDLISAAPVGPAPSAGAAGAVAPVYAGGAGLGGPLSGATARSPTPSPMVPTGVAPSLARAPGVPAAPASHLDRLDPASQAAHSAAAAQEHARALHTQTRLHPGAGGPNGAGRVAPLGGGGQMSIAELMAATTQNASSGPRGHGHQATPSSPMSSTYGTSDEALQFDLTVLVDLRHASHGTLNAKQDFSKDLIVLGNTSMRGAHLRWASCLVQVVAHSDTA